MKQKLLIFSFLCAFTLSNLSAQSTIVTGTVSDPGGHTLPGVAILEKGTDNGVITNSEGTFSISVNSDAVLVFSFIGFESKEESVTGKQTLTVVLDESVFGLDEVVAIGYGSARKKDITGAVATVNDKEFTQGHVTNAEQLIANKVPGLQVIPSSGKPGAGSSFLIRGGASLNASNDPLIVIDGVPIEGAGDGPSVLSSLNPNDIASFSVLKDASAAAIYGSRASNGVILITTQKGDDGKVKVSFNSKMSVAEVVNTVPVLTGDQYREVVKDAAAYSGKDLDWFASGTENTNWQDEIYQQALSTDNNVSISGGIKNLPYRLSLGYLNQDGVLKTSNFSRFTSNLNINPTFFDNHLKVNVSLKASMEKQRIADERAIASAVSYDPTQPIRTEDSNFGGYFEYEEYASNPAVFHGHYNPVGMLEQVDSRSETMRSIGNIQLDYKLHFLPELHVNLNTGYDVSKSKSDYFMPETAFEQNIAQGSIYKADPSTEVQNVYFESYLNYVKDLSSIQSRVDAMVGYSYNDFLRTNYFYPSYNAFGEEQPNTTPTFPFDKPQHTLISFYARANYFFKDRYLLTATIRQDGSSRFAEDNRWGTFPSIAFAWKISHEDFMKGFDSLSDLKLRTGYGVTGQQDGIGDYGYIPTYTQGELTNQYQIGDSFYRISSPSPSDRNRKWEQTATTNIGLDWGFFEQRLSGAIDFYSKKTTDLLNTVNVPLGTDFTNSITKNIGSMENRGIEINVKAIPVQTEDFTWNIAANFTYNDNKITSLSLDDANDVGLLSGSYLVNTVGYSRNVFYLYHQVYDTDGSPLEETMLDVNKDGMINDQDRYRSESAVPKYTIGFSTGVTYKNWTANIDMHSNLGHYMYFRPADNMVAVYGYVAPYNLSTAYYDTEFKMSTNQAQNFSDYYLQNASFLRIDNLNLGYEFKELFKSFHSYASLRLSASIQNVYTFTNYTGQDPEASWNWGIDYGINYPRPRTYAIGLTLNL